MPKTITKQHPLKLGIVLSEFEYISNFELRILKTIKEDPSLDLALLIKEEETVESERNGFWSRCMSFMRSASAWGSLLLKLQLAIEQRLFKAAEHTSLRKEVAEYIDAVEVLALGAKPVGTVVTSSPGSVAAVKAHGLDMLLQTRFHTVGKEFMNVCKYGVWSFCYDDETGNRGEFAGFSQMTSKQDVVSVTLKQLRPEGQDDLVIDQAYYNPHYSFVKTKRLMREGTVSLFFKHIRNLQQGLYALSVANAYCTQIYTGHRGMQVVRYMMRFYAEVLNRMTKRLQIKLHQKRYHSWTLCIGYGHFMESPLTNLQPLELPKDEFWADPFILEHNEEEYVFFENYSYLTQKGIISCGKIQGDTLTEIVDVLEQPYHLSYPFVFKEGENLFMMPETRANKRLEIYKCKAFPDQWELYTTAFENQNIEDATFYTDNNEQKWLFLNKQVADTAPSDCELFIYKVDSVALTSIEPHKQNPVIINAATARNAGPFFNYKGDTFRPSQANTQGIYGRALNLNRVEELSLEVYKEENVKTIYPHFRKGLAGVHHLHQHHKRFVIDVAHRRK